MELSGGIKSDIRELYYNRNYSEAIKKLVILYNKKYSNPLDNYFILYNLALYNMKLERESGGNDFSIAKYYIVEAYRYFEPIKSDYEVQYHNIIWASIEMYKDEVSKEELLDLYTLLYDYFKKIGYKRNEVGMYINILKIQNKNELIPQLLNDINDTNDEEIVDLIKDILQECKSLGCTYLDIALNIISRKENYVAL